jgi:predicted nucleic acid-binding Zn ribbon protein
MRNRAPRPLAAAIEIARGRAAPRTPLAAVQQVWREVAGEQVAAASEPVSERDGVVVVRCDGAVWAQELDLMQDRLLEALRDRIGDVAPNRLRFESR